MNRTSYSVLLGVLLLSSGQLCARSLSDIRTSGELRVCVAGSSAPFYQTNAEAFAHAIGVKAAVTKLDNWDQQFKNAQGTTEKDATYEAALLADDRCDVFPNDLHIVPWRASKMLLVPYYGTLKVVVAHRDLRPIFGDINALAGHTAAVQKDTAYDSWLKEQNEKRFSSKPVVIQYAPTAQSMALVAGKTAEFTVIGAESAFKWVRGDLGNLDILFPVDEPVQVGWGISPRSGDLRDALETYFVDSTRVASELDRSWQRNYGISLMEYKLFEASFANRGIELKTVLAWSLPLVTGVLGVLAAMVFWTRRLRRLVAAHELTEKNLQTSQQQIALETQRSLMVSRVSQALQHVDDPANFGRIVLSELVPELGACIGAFYIRPAGDGVFHCVAAYSIAVERCQPIRPGEGLAGEAVLDGKARLVHDIPADYMRLESGAFSAAPSTILVVPVTGSDGIVALLEFGYLAEPQNYDAVLADVLTAVSFSLEILRNRISEQADHKQRVASEERQNLIFSSMQDGLFGQDAQGRVTFVNAAALRLLGYTEAELIGRVMHAVIQHHYADGRDIANESRAIFMTLQDGQARTVADEVFWRKDGTCFPVEYTTTALREDGKITGAVASFRDITERKAADAAIRAAKELAEEATKTKSDFLANMSHEIRTPMNAIIGMSHLALQTPLDKKQRNYIEKVNRAGENLLGIINDILDFSKIEAGKMSMEAIDFRLEDVMDHLANLLGMKTEDKGLELLFNCAADVPTALVGDSLRLGQVLINLGNNAVKFTEAGEIVVNIEKVAEDDNGVELHFWVRDTGIGMTLEQCGKMFQSFSQADASTTRKYGGTGLGLAISKTLVELMNGRIWVESEAGKGSSFHFHARFGVQADPMARKVVRPEALLGLRVLVVDDNASAREILSTMARTYGMEVDTAWDGHQALDMVVAAEKNQLPYDLVLMDWKMPGMDGVATVQHIQSERLAKSPTVIMVTAYGRDEAVESAGQRGVVLNTVLTKPISARSLLDAVGEVLGKQLVSDDRPVEKANSYEESMAQLRGARILLVEDNGMNQELAMELLNQAGVEVVLANNGLEAVEILARDSAFDGVLMDCQMPVMDGYTATREIRKNPAFAELPIIAMTANAMAGDKEKVIEAGMWDHIAKPLNVGDMFSTIAKWVKPKNPQQAAKDPAELVGATPHAPVQVVQSATNTVATRAYSTGATATFDINGSLPGIDVKAGMATTMDNQKLFVRMLVKFRDSQGNFADLFAAAQTDADLVAPTRAAHTLKGTAGNIGAKGVQAAAGALEHALIDKVAPERIDELLQRALAELAPVIAGLQQVGAAAPVATVSMAPALDTVKLRAGIERLTVLLQDSDSDAADLVEELAALASGTAMADALKRVAAAVANYDFDAALEHLQALK